MKDDLRRAHAAQLRSQLNKAGDEFQGLKNLVLDLASELEDVKDRLEVLEKKSTEASRRPQSGSGG
jgi:predicted  nucleic acid-binding Zn-ribbon protein